MTMTYWWTQDWITWMNVNLNDWIRNRGVFRNQIVGQIRDMGGGRQKLFPLAARKSLPTIVRSVFLPPPPESPPPIIERSGLCKVLNRNMGGYPPLPPPPLKMYWYPLHYTIYISGQTLNICLHSEIIYPLLYEYLYCILIQDSLLFVHIDIYFIQA